MIWALLAAFLLGGGTTGGVGILSPELIKKMINQVEREVVDVDRSKAAVATLKTMNKELKGF